MSTTQSYGVAQASQETEHQRPGEPTSTARHASTTARGAGSAGIAAEVRALAAQSAAITRRLDALAAAVEQRTSATGPPCGPEPILSERILSPADVASRAARLSRTWVQRAYRHPLQAALVAEDDWKSHLRAAIDRGRLLSDTSVDQARRADMCPFGRWLASGDAATLDPVRTAEITTLHADHHRASAEVLSEVAAGRLDEARHLMVDENGYAGVARRLSDALSAWIDTLDPQTQNTWT
ncbi:MAG: CZB domain-containing protein [Micrococcales bacterium]|nr:CZB domain-containing protein [Micrococcales bacterium]